MSVATRRIIPFKPRLNDPAQAIPKPSMFIGSSVQVTRGPAVGARGMVTNLEGDRLTMFASLLPHRPLFLTVDVKDCVPLDASGQHAAS